jgi:PAS domain S-box-containing protein
MSENEATLDLHGLFEAWPGLFLVLAPDGPRFTILAVSDAYLRATGTERAQLVGRSIFEVLTDGTDPDGGDPHDLRASLEAVARDRTIDASAPRRRLLAPLAEASGPNEQWWRLVNAPVLGPDGNLRYIIHQAEDVAELVRRRQAETAARQAEERWAFQLRLGEALRSLTTPAEVQARACQMLGEHLRANRAHFAEIEGDHFTIRTSYVRGVPPFQSSGSIEMFGTALLESYRRGQSVAVDDVETDPRFTPSERARLRAAGTAAFAGAMLTRADRWVASVGVHSVTPRAWTPDDVATIAHVADRIWTAAERARAESALREGEARYSAIFEESPIGIALTRWSDRVLVSANRAFLRMLELGEEEALGRTSVDLMISTPAAQAQVQTALESRGAVRDFECERRTRSGSTRILSLNIDWVFVNGEKHVLTTIRDVTDLRAAQKAARLREEEHLVERANAEALRRSESKYSGIIQMAEDAIVSVDDRQNITLFNKAAESTFGYAQEEALGAPLELLVPERFRAAHRERVARFAAGAEVSRMGSERTGRLFGRRKDGEEFPAEATLSKVTVDGKTILTAAVRDMTSKLRGEVEQRLLSDIGSTLAARIDENLALASLTKLAVRELADLSTLYLIAEDGSIQRHGVACRDPAAQWMTELMMSLPVDRRTEHPLWEILETGHSRLMQLETSVLASYALTDEHRRALDTIRPRSVIGVPLLAGAGILGALFVAACRPSRAFDDRDVALLEEIARRVALSLENARLYRAAQKAVALRDEVLSIVAHDLRSPLGSVLLHTSLTRPPPGQPERRARRPAEAIERSVSHMRRLIDDLLDVTRMESGQLELERAGVEPGELVAEVVESHRDRAAVESIELRNEVTPNLPAAWADRDRMLQVFENLIGNALRVTARGSISVGAIERAGEILFWVADTGPGIASEDLPHVFDRFWQARKTKRGSAGLGLSIVKAIVEAHAGRVWFESMLGAGTTVFFTVPLAETAATAAARPEPPR